MVGFKRQERMAHRQEGRAGEGEALATSLIQHLFTWVPCTVLGQELIGEPNGRGPCPAGPHFTFTF